MRIQLTSKSGVTTKEGKFGKTFQEIDIEFLDLDGDRPKKKHLVSFNFKDFSKIVEAGIGSSWQITTKPAKDPQYVDWVDATPLAAGEGSTAPASTARAIGSTTNANGGAGVSTPAYKSTYETPEERAKKQVYIVRQSAINAAIAYLSADCQGKTMPDVNVVTDIARKFEAYVFNGNVSGGSIPTVE